MTMTTEQTTAPTAVDLAKAVVRAARAVEKLKEKLADAAQGIETA